MEQNRAARTRIRWLGYVFILASLGVMVLLAGCKSEGETTGTLACTPDVDYTSFVVIDTRQERCYDRDGNEITCPDSGATYYGQDAQYQRYVPSYSRLCGSDIVLDNHTHLMWQKAHNNTRVNAATATAACDNLFLGGFSDWRLPSIKELYSLADFRGKTGSIYFLDTDYFDLQPYDFDSGDLTGTHSAEMMGQTWSSTPRPDDSTLRYFFNFLNGHLKSGPYEGADIEAKSFYRCVRGNNVFQNGFSDNGDTITDSATGLVWQKSNGEEATDDYRFAWREALSYCENLELDGETDWRLPDIKELQSIVDYTNENYALNRDLFIFNGYDPSEPTSAPYFWSSTTHKDEGYGTYICFGHCWDATLETDLHGPGAQRADPKYDNGSLPVSIGDQEDYVQAENYVRCVRTNN